MGKVELGLEKAPILATGIDHGVVCENIGKCDILHHLLINMSHFGDHPKLGEQILPEM